MTATLLTDGVLRPGDPDFAFLPAPAVQNHAANLAVLPGGDLGCVWFGGTQEGVPDISIWFSRLADDTWSTPTRLSSDDTRSEQNPVLTTAPNGDLWLLYTAQRAGNQDTAEVRQRVSVDGGTTWSPHVTLFPATQAGGVFVRQPPVLLPSGRWLLPVFHCVATPGRAWVGEHDTSAVMISDDGGATWRERSVPGSTGCVHMNIQPLPDGTLLALYRSRWADHIYRSVSTDDGWTWTEPTPTTLPNNNSSIQYVPLRDGALALVYNHSSKENATGRRSSLYDEISDEGVTEQTASPATGNAFWGAPRAPMSLALSDDGGHTWRRRDLDLQRSAPLGQLSTADGALMWRVHVEAATVLMDTLAHQLPDGARVVLIGSRTMSGVPGKSQYAATKAALVALARSWAAELVSPDEVAGLTTFLLGPDAGAITGQQFVQCAGASL